MESALQKRSHHYSCSFNCIGCLINESFKVCHVALNLEHIMNASALSLYPKEIETLDLGVTNTNHGWHFNDMHEDTVQCMLCQCEDGWSPLSDNLWGVSMWRCALSCKSNDGDSSTEDSEEFLFRGRVIETTSAGRH